MTFGQPVTYAQPNMSVTYLIFTDELFSTWTCLFLFRYRCIDFLVLIHTAVKELDSDSESCSFSGLDLDWLLLDLIKKKISLIVLNS